jgi:hypothetical protein
MIFKEFLMRTILINTHELIRLFATFELHATLPLAYMHSRPHFGIIFLALPKIFSEASLIIFAWVKIVLTKHATGSAIGTQAKNSYYK